ncbi:MAG: sulfatase-like hydrolase/transferase, partial [Planctomycetota bacterium]|nr:sulfatase-like hydrolase/transferase [Planctomycetota bacterium]
MKLPLLAFGLVLVTISATRLIADQPARPNILYFYVDDMGWGAIGPNGQLARQAKGLPYVRTPNLDLLARQGLNFTRGYGCHVCSPARSSQQSGFHQGHTYADRNDPNNAKKAMRADDILMGDALSAAGYVTGYWGKWGYGGSKDPVRPVIENIQTLPTSHGYKYVLAELHHVRAHTFFQPTLWSAPAASQAVGGLELIPNSLARYRDNE